MPDRERHCPSAGCTVAVVVFLVVVFLAVTVRLSAGAGVDNGWRTGPGIRLNVLSRYWLTSFCVGNACCGMSVRFT